MSFNHSPKIVTDGLVLCLDAKDLKSYSGSGTTWNDRSGNGNNGTLVNGVSAIGGSMVFDGTNKYVSIANNNTLQIIGDQTIEYFYTPTNIGARRNVYNKAYAGEGTITHEPNGNLNYYYGTHGGNGAPYQGFGTAGTPVALTNNTYHIVLVRDLIQRREGNKFLYWYINGVLNNRSLAVYDSAVAGNSPVLLGAGYTTNAHGRLHSLRLYNKALSPAEILQNYNATKSRFNLL
jgi:hypothetical protein